MKTDYVNVELETLSSTKNLMINKINEIIELIDSYTNIINESENCFVTNAAVEYRTTAINYTKILKSFINNDFLPLINALDNIKKLYEDQNNAISKGIGE